MRIRVKKSQDGIPIVGLEGTLEGGKDSRALVRVLVGMAKSGHLDVVIDLGGVKWISSPGLGILVRSQSEYLKYGGRMHLCCLNDRNLRLLMVTRTRLLFDVHDSTNEARASAMQA